MAKVMFLFCAAFWLFAGQACADVLFVESMGSVSSTVSIAGHEAAGGFDNVNLTMNSGAQNLAADIRSSGPSSGYLGASGGANVYFPLTTGDYGFGIAGFNSLGYSNLLLSFGYYKSSAFANAALRIDVSSGGSSWKEAALTGLPAENAPAGWYWVADVALPAQAVSSTMALRWVKSGAISTRIDDVKLEGTPNSSDYGFGLTRAELDGVDMADSPAARTVSLAMTATRVTNVTNIACSAGSAHWTYVGSTAFGMAAGDTANLQFRYTPAAHDGLWEQTTATITTDNTPAVTRLSLAGRAVRERSLAVFKADSESSRAGDAVYKIAGAIVNANTLLNGRGQLYAQSEAAGGPATRGILIDDLNGLGRAGGALPAVGSVLTLYGRPANRYGMTALACARAYAVTGACGVTPLELTGVSALGDAQEGVLATVPRARIPAGFYAPGVSTSYAVTDGAGSSFLMRIIANSGVSVSSDGGEAALTGVVTQDDAASPLAGGSGYALALRYASEAPVELARFDLE